MPPDRSWAQKLVKRRNKSGWEFGIAAVFALTCAVVVLSVQKSSASPPHIWVSGTLSEWQVIGRRTSPALRLRMAEEKIDFRVDPSLFREAMRKVIPPEFERGARVSVLVLEDEYAHPVTPRLAQDVRIAWVRGLKADDREIFASTAALAWEQKNRRWSYVLLVVSIGFTVYSWFKWRRVSLPKKTMEPTR